MLSPLLLTGCQLHLHTQHMLKSTARNTLARQRRRRRRRHKTYFRVAYAGVHLQTLSVGLVFGHLGALAGRTPSEAFKPKFVSVQKAIQTLGHCCLSARVRGFTRRSARVQNVHIYHHALWASETSSNLSGSEKPGAHKYTYTHAHTNTQTLGVGGWVNAAVNTAVNPNVSEHGCGSAPRYPPG